MTADKRTDGFKRTNPAPGPISGNSSPPASEILQQFSQQLDLIHPGKMPAKMPAKSYQETADPQPAADARPAGALHDWEQEDTVQRMVNSLLAGTFDESITVHAENLAEKLIERQRQLDRRESQLNLRSAELENKVRQARLDNVPMQAASEIEKAIEAELAVDQQAELGIAVAANVIQRTSTQPLAQSASKFHGDPSSPADERSADRSAGDNGDNIVTHRLDKFSESQRAPYSQLNKRWKRYIEDSRAEHALKIHNQRVEQPLAESREQAQISSVNRTAIRDLTKRAAAVRQRGEDVENMFEQLREIFSEMLHQQTTLRQVVKTLHINGKKANLSELEAAESTLDRLRLGLNRVGNQHFLLPEESADAA